MFAKSQTRFFRYAFLFPIAKDTYDVYRWKEYRPAQESINGYKSETRKITFGTSYTPT